MAYVINNRIIYRDDTSELSVIDDEQYKVSLTATINRLLLLFVKNENKVLSREFLLSQVWGSYGQIESGNNLNNALSQLRKALAELGEGEVLITLPKQGIQFQAGVVRTDETGNQENPELNKIIIGNGSSRGMKYLLLCIAVAIFIGGLAMFGIGMRQVHIPTTQFVPAQRIDNCEIEMINSHHKLVRTSISVRDVRNIIAEGGFDCNKPATIYYYNGGALVLSALHSSATFLAYCPDNGKVTNAACENVYVFKK
ncbi:winged helix-turn-helix domain-containing protein [Serratia surfactantfaciens]|jgi:DNA-binding winged helix-turn-helix (wHTH) protein|uniref:Winged helix-turn-helix domain-containing protein n=1 Tax=Serratia surfactantfaciens TaxID=2741499 RepID=A0ABS0M447_9GAMM|nr:winged helix-turn-helix domain-containing protein [Serratia surfactantfaciens]MBH1922362.1 winged helix-turn-helix domain-containing protein [Serratia surfactantfaciens]